MDWLENVKKIKKEKGLTNETLSEKSGISQGTLNKLLSGATTDPKLSTLSSLSEALGCTIDNMLGNTRDNRMRFALNEELMSKYRELDKSGKETVDYIIEKEYTRVMREREAAPYSLESPKVKQLRLYNMAVSAGTGSYLSSDDYKKISVYSNPTTDIADFAVRVSGDSMMPKYCDGDILLIAEADKIDPGELGIFSVNGDGYFKQYGGDRLVSLNPSYKDIMFSDYDDIVCFGRVIGKLKK